MDVLYVNNDAIRFRFNDFTQN